MRESDLLQGIKELDFNYHNGSVYYEGDLIDGISCELSYENSREYYIMIWDDEKDIVVDVDAILNERIVNVLGEVLEDKKRELDDADADYLQTIEDRNILNLWLYE